MQIKMLLVGPLKQTVNSGSSLKSSEEPQKLIKFSSFRCPQNGFQLCHIILPTNTSIYFSKTYDEPLFATL